MFGIFKKRKKSGHSLLYPIRSKIGQLIEGKQRRWAEYLGEKANGWSRKKLKLALLAFCLIQGGASTYILLGVFSTPSFKNNVEQISIPAHVIQRDTLYPDQQEVIISKREYQRFKGFREYMDSLQHDPQGRNMYDSILHSRPGLLDSLSLLESIYQQQIRR